MTIGNFTLRPKRKLSKGFKILCHCQQLKHMRKRSHLLSKICFSRCCAMRKPHSNPTWTVSSSDIYVMAPFRTVYMDQITHRISALQWLCRMTIYNKIMYEQQNGSTVHELTEHSEEPAAPALALNCITSSTRIGRLCNKLEIDIRPTIKSSR